MSLLPELYVNADTSSRVNSISDFNVLMLHQNGGVVGWKKEEEGRMSFSFWRV
jgi:hypothetical protein